MDNRSKKFVFIPFCLMAQAYQAQGIVKYEWKSSIKPFMQLLLDYDINSLIREPKGLSKYNTKEFNNHCELLADSVSKEVIQLVESGYQVLAILGIEQSPSCCVNYIYTNKGTENRKGLYMEKLCDKIKYLEIPIIGINRKYIQKSLKELENILKHQ